MRILLVGFVALTSACNFTFSRLEKIPPGSAGGRTVDVDGKTAISFSKIGVDSTKRIVRSLGDGTFLVQGLTNGAWLLRMAADDDGDGVPERSAIRAVNITNVVDPTGKHELSSVLLGDVTLDGTATLIGTVKDPTGNPAPAARVVVFRNTSDLDAQQSVGVSGFSVDLGAESETGSDAQGLFRLPGVNRGKVRVVAVSADGSSTSAPVAADAEPGKIVVVGDVKLLPPSTPPATRAAQVDVVNPPSDGTIRVDVVKAGADPKKQSDILVSHSAPAGKSIAGFSVPQTVVDVYVTDVSPAGQDRRSGVMISRMVSAGTDPLEWGNVELTGGDPCGDPKDRDGDGLAALPDPTSSAANRQLWVDCAPQCADKFGDASGAAFCTASDGNKYDCDDDADGQPDVTEPFACVSLCQGDDADGDGICSSSDPFPQCAQNDPNNPACSFESHAFVPPKPIYGGEGEGEGEGGFLALDLQPADSTEWAQGQGDVNNEQNHGSCDDPQNPANVGHLNPSEQSFNDEGSNGVTLVAVSDTAQCCTCIEQVRTIRLAQQTNITSFKGHLNTTASGDLNLGAADLRIKFNQGTTFLEDFMIASDPDGTANGCIGSFHDAACNAGQVSEPHYVQVQNDGTFTVPLCSVEGADNVEVHLQAYGCGNETVTTSLDSLAIGSPDFGGEGEGEGEGAGEGEGEGADPCLGLTPPSCATTGDQSALCQAHVDLLAGCTSLDGNFLVGGADVHDLTGLSSLTTINGGLTVETSQLTSLAGLEALTSVNSLVLNGNDSLTDVSALSHLTRVGPTIDILGNNLLTGLHGLENVTDLSNTSIAVSFAPAFTDLSAVARQHVQSLTVFQSGFVNFNSWSAITNPEIDTLDIESNANLTSLVGIAPNGGLSAPTAVIVKDNPVLADATALNGLTSVGAIDIENCPGIGALTLGGISSAGAIVLKDMPQTDLPVFSLMAVAGALDIENLGMTALTGLAATKTITSSVVIKGNLLLTSFGTFTPTSIGGGVDVENNTGLSQCDVTTFATNAGVAPANVINTGNNSLCP
jgi:hypothetical protein